jgi:hypothetical protein
LQRIGDWCTGKHRHAKAHGIIQRGEYGLLRIGIEPTIDDDNLIFFGVEF